MRDSAHSEGIIDRVGTRTIGITAFVLLTAAALGSVPLLSSASPTSRSAATGLVTGTLVAGAAIAALVSWRRHAAAPDRPLGDGLAVGLGLGCVAAGHLVHLVRQVPTDPPVSAPVQVLIGVAAGAQLAAAALALVRRVLRPPTDRLLVATMLVVVLRVLMTAGPSAPWRDTLIALALAAVSAGWFATAWGCLQRAANDARVVQAPDLDLDLLLRTRDQRERMHELRSTLAGLVNGSALLDCADIPDATRQRLLHSVRRELDRMQRLLTEREEAATHLDLDDALEVILDLQRLKGREVELRSSGDSVRASYDSLAEVVNILIDNAATHGGCDSSRVEVVRRDEETVDITVTDYGRGIPPHERERIFDWGHHGDDSPGEGIGLHLAQRLVAEDGGSLRLVDAQGPGSAFVISLPAVRRSPEDDVSEDSHATWRRSG